MSDPRPPYYFKTTGVTYHWETECSENNYPDTDWQKNSFQPFGRKQILTGPTFLRILLILQASNKGSVLCFHIEKRIEITGIWV